MIKNIIIVCGLLLLIGFGYYLIVLEDQNIQSRNQQVITNAQVEAQEFLQRLQNIQSIELDTDILTDPRFTNRVDYTTPVPAVPVGRDNPFVPAGSN